MKKNRTMKLAAILLVLTLITSCFVGGTFAKYITTGTASDKARVAHWGFDEGTATAFADLFTPDNETAISTSGGEFALIAPGSSGSETFTFVNADATTNPEVAYKVTFSTAGSTTALSDDLEEALSFTLQVTGETKVECATWADLLKAIAKLSGDTADETDGIHEYEANAAVPAALQNGKDITIGWSWEFGNGSTDDRDTGLGNKDVTNADVAKQLEQIMLQISVTVEQLDVYPTPATP